VLPPTTAAFAAAKGYRTFNDGTTWGFFAKIAEEHGLTCTQSLRFDDAKMALATGKLVVASMRPGHFTGSGHYVLLVGIRDDWIEVYDPNHNNRKYGADGLIDQGVRNDGKVSAKESVIRSEAGQYWIFDKEDDEVDKAAFEALQETVKQQARQLDEQAAQLKDLQDKSNMDAPSWAQTAVAAAVKAGHINTPNGGSYDFYRLLTTMYRAGLIK
jgi:hypothetical protein